MSVPDRHENGCSEAGDPESGHAGNRGVESGRARGLVWPVVTALGAAAVLTVAVAAPIIAGHDAEAVDPAAPPQRAATTATPESVSASKSSAGVMDPFSCPPGQLPGLDQRDPPGNAAGGSTPKGAVAALVPGAERIIARPFAKVDGAPVWLEAAGKTFVATLRPDGTWQAAFATVVGCRAP